MLDNGDVQNVQGSWDRFGKNCLIGLISSFIQETIASMEVTSESRHRLDNSELWLVQPGGNKDWLKNLSMALLDSGGVRNEALLLTRPLCEVH